MIDCKRQIQKNQFYVRSKIASKHNTLFVAHVFLNNSLHCSIYSQESTALIYFTYPQASDFFLTPQKSKHFTSSPIRTSSTISDVRLVRPSPTSGSLTSMNALATDHLAKYLILVTSIISALQMTLKKGAVAMTCVVTCGCRTFG